jgi:hypothetical protein
MTDLAIHVENIGKRYRLGGGVVQYRTLRETLGERFNSNDNALPSGKEDENL